MGRETRIRADRKLRIDHLKRTYNWHKAQIDKVEQLIINNMRSNDPDCSQIAKYIAERECEKLNCVKSRIKLHGR
jgi:hypothetical protein